MRLKVSPVIEFVERVIDEFFRLLDGEAHHRAGGVENEDQFFGRDVGSGELSGRLKDQGEISACSGFGSGNGLRFGLRENCVGDLLAGDVVLQDEIFVGNLG